MQNNYCFKVVQNKELEIYQETHLKKLENDYNELLDLISMFSTNAEHHRLKVLKAYKSEYDKTYKPQIKEAKRLLKNTKSRLTYNMNKF